MVADRISKLKGYFTSDTCKVFNQLDVRNTFHPFRTSYVLDPVNKAANHVIVVSKKYYFDALAEELGINSVNSNNPTYILINDSLETILKRYNEFMTSVGLEMLEQD